MESPFDKQVTENTRFWNASGIDMTLNAQGLKVQTQSMMSILSGGIAFDLPEDTPPGTEAGENLIFHLYPDQASIHEKTYTVRDYWLLLFDESVRGLSVGAPVELHGIKVGEVVSLNLIFDATDKKFSVPVVVDYKARKAFDELTQTLRSLRDLVDTLDNRPQSLIFGKEKESHE